MLSPMGRLSCVSALVHTNKSSYWEYMEVELGDIVGTFVVDDVGELGEGDDCILGEGAVLCLDGG